MAEQDKTASASAAEALSVSAASRARADEFLAEQTALTRLTYAAVPAFVSRGGGAIINIASIVAVAPEHPCCCGTNADDNGDPPAAGTPTAKPSTPVHRI